MERIFKIGKRSKSKEDKPKIEIVNSSFQVVTHLDAVESSRDQGDVGRYRRILDPKIQQSLRTRKDSMFVKIPSVGDELSKDLMDEINLTFARSQSMDDLDNYEIMNVTAQASPVKSKKLTRQYSKSFHDIDRLDGDNTSFDSGSPMRQTLREQKSSDSTFYSTHSSSFGTPPPSFVPTTISTEEHSGIFERDVQDVSKSLENLTNSLKNSNCNSIVNKENTPDYLLPNMTEPVEPSGRKQSTDRDKKLEELLKKWNNSAPTRSNRSTPRSSNYNSQESLENLDTSKASPRLIGSELDRLVPAPPVPRQRSKNVHERGTAETDAYSGAPAKPPREPLSAKSEHGEFKFQIPAPLPRSSQQPIPKPRIKYKEYEEKVEYL